MGDGLHGKEGVGAEGRSLERGQLEVIKGLTCNDGIWKKRLVKRL